MNKEKIERYKFSFTAASLQVPVMTSLAEKMVNEGLTLDELKPEDEEVRIHLVTYNNEEFLETANQGFSELGDSLEELGITFTYEFNDVQHDRCIEMNNGWKIILGRGLDIWQKTSGRFDIAEFYQEKRLCKEFEVTVVRG